MAKTLFIILVCSFGILSTVTVNKCLVKLFYVYFVVGCRFFGLLEELAVRRFFVLSLAIKFSKACLTKAVFYLMPVNRDVFSNILSSIFNVILIRINMY